MQLFKMADHITLGKNGEDLAAAFLETNGYRIESRNYRYKKGEIDLIASRDTILVFVEVKVRSKNNYGHPEEAVNDKKEELIITTADNYIYENNWKGEIRFDIISILDKKEILHIEDAFN